MSAQELVKLCTRKKRTIASCESLTAGLFSAEIASVSGASKALKGGIVTYFTEIKEKVVGVDTEVISNTVSFLKNVRIKWLKDTGIARERLLRFLYRECRSGYEWRKSRLV